MAKTLLLTCDYPPMHGGISNYLWHLWSGLPREKTVILAPATPGHQRWDKASGQRLYRMPMLMAESHPGKLRQILLLFFQTLRVLARENIREIHGGHGISSGVTCYLCKKLYNIPYYLYLYGGELQKYHTKGIPQKLLKPIFNNATALITCSEYVKTEYERYGIKNRFIVISPGIDSGAFCGKFNGEELKEKYDLKGKKILLIVSRLVERKGHDTVIRCLPQIIEKVPDAVYVVVGTGPYRKRLEALASEMGVEDRVVFTGYVPQPMLPAFFGCCDVFVMLSRSTHSRGDVEGFGIVFLEAGAAEKPVVGGRSGGTIEAIAHGETGFLVDPLNKTEIIRSIVELLTDRQLAEAMGKQGRQRAATQFNWDSRVDAIRRLLV